MAPITHPSGRAGDQFGRCVRISGDGLRFVVCTHAREHGGLQNPGEVLVYTWDAAGTVSLESVLRASDAAANDQFGISADINHDGDRIIVGAFAADVGGQVNAGKVYIFERSGTTWTEVDVGTASNPVADDWYGSDVAVGG